mgnify:CR=1 FL=1
MFEGSCHCKKVCFQIETENIYEDIYNLQLKPQEDFFKEIDISKDGLV